MTRGVYYNEIDPFAAQWLRNLITAGHLPAGDVDTRSITEVQPDDLIGYAQCHFFAGIGGWPLALRLAGWDDEREIWTGSCPCQPFSVAGLMRGTDDPRHLWPQFSRLIAARKPAVVMGEQVAGAAGYRWFDGVANDLEGQGYSCEAVDIPACAVNAPHRRHRLYWVALDTNAKRREQSRKEPCHREAGRVGRIEQPVSWDRDWESALRDFRVLDDGLSYGVAATDAARNAIVPPLAAQVIASVMDVIDN